MNTKASFTPAILLSIWRKARLINLIDEKFRGLLRSGRLAAVYYSPRGQEILAAAMGVHLQPSDYLVTTYRGIHDQLAKGIPLKPLFAEYYAKATGACKGKGGPMHITHPETGVMVTTGIVGSGLPIANGITVRAQPYDVVPADSRSGVGGQSFAAVLGGDPRERAYLERSLRLYAGSEERLAAVEFTRLVKQRVAVAALDHGVEARHHA